MSGRRQLFRSFLPMIFGEARSEEVLDIINAMATGHDGCLGVVHGSSPYDVVARLETMIMMSGLDLPLWEIRKMVTSNIDLIVHQERMTDGSKKITHIMEVEGVGTDGLHEVKLQDLFKFRIEKLESDGKVIGKSRSVIEHYPIFSINLKILDYLSAVYLRKRGAYVIDALHIAEQIEL